MKTDEDKLLDDFSPQDDFYAIILQQERRRSRFNFMLGLVSGASLCVFLLLFARHIHPLVIDYGAKPTPLTSQPLYNIMETVEVVEFKNLGIDRPVTNVQVPEKLQGKVSNLRTAVPRKRISGPTNATCGITISDRFDCLPGDWPVSAEFECAMRDCCWDSSAPKGGVPYCFYPDNIVGYSASSTKISENGMSAVLTRETESPYPDDVVELQFDVVYQTESTVRFRIYDPNNKRYEVPLNLSHPEPGSPGDYKISLQNSPFGIHISRKSTGATLFDSRNMAPLVFADQFLQIGTKLSSPNIYGLGEHQSSIRLDINWKRLVMWARDMYPDGGGNLYGYHPFYINLEADGQAHGVFLLSSNAMEVALQPYAGGQGGLTYRTLGGILDFYVFTGPTPLKVVEQYVSLIGRPFMPPFWALGFHLCKYGYGSAKVLNETIQRNRAAKIPYDVQWNDIDYMDAYKDWTYDANNTYAGLPEIVDDLHAHNQRYIMIIDPGISSTQPAGTYPPYDDGVEMDIFIKNATGQILIGKVWPGLTAFPDFFHPKAQGYWFKQMKAYHKTIKFDGIWIDMNELSNFIDGSTNGCTRGHLDQPPYVPPGVNGKSLHAATICPSAKQYLSTNYNLHSMYGLSEMRATAGGLRQLLGKRSFVLSRSSYSSLGHYGAHWTGDNRSLWSDMYYSIPSILKMNIFGITMVGADTCGFEGTTNRELCIRWMQLASFYPFMRNHDTLGNKNEERANCKTGKTQVYMNPGILNFNLFGIPMMGAEVCGFALNTTRELCIRWTQLGSFYPFMRNHASFATTKPQDPAAFDPEALGYMRDTLNTRYSLLPFMYTCFYVGHLTGTPVVRALFTMFPNTETIDKQFMWGDALLVSPVLEQGAVKVDAYFPKGLWYDVYNGTLLETVGEETMVLDAPINTINAHIRGGSIVARLPPAVTTNEMRTKPFILQVAPDENSMADGLLYWDDGEVLDPVENNKYSLLNFTLSGTTLTSDVKASNFGPMPLDTVQVFGVPSSPSSVTLNGQAIKVVYDASSKVLSVSKLNLDLLKTFNLTWKL